MLGWSQGDRASFGVYAAPKITVVLELDERTMNPLIDKFGLDALIFKREGGKIYASVKAPLSPQFFGWLLQLGPMVKIESPKGPARCIWNSCGARSERMKKSEFESGLTSFKI